MASNRVADAYQLLEELHNKWCATYREKNLRVQGLDFDLRKCIYDGALSTDLDQTPQQLMHSFEIESLARMWDEYGRVLNEHEDAHKKCMRTRRALEIAHKMPEIDPRKSARAEAMRNMIAARQADGPRV
jgi:hypothetical protein